MMTKDATEDLDCSLDIASVFTPGNRTYKVCGFTVIILSHLLGKLWGLLIFPMKYVKCGNSKHFYLSKVGNIEWAFLPTNLVRL